MGYLDTYHKNLKAETNQIKPILMEKMISSVPEIRKEIKERWLIGERPDGNIIGVYAGEGYSMFKYRMNPMAGGDVDLTLSGRMGDMINIDTLGDRFEVYSNVPYYDKIVENYGEYNFNLSEEQTEELLNKIGGEILTEMFSKLWRA